MPCSRMPKCSVRPPMRPGSTESASAFSLLASGAPGDRLRALDRRVRRRREVGRAADELGDRRGERRDAGARAHARGHAGRRPRGRAARPPSRRAARPRARGRARRRAPGRRCQLRRVQRVPGGVVGGAALALREVGVDLVGHVERAVGIPAVGLLGEPHLLLAERRAVRLRRVLRVRGADRDVRAHDDQRRALGLGVGGVERGAQVVGRPAVVEVLDVEAVGLVAQPDVLAEREARSSPRS